MAGRAEFYDFADLTGDGSNTALPVEQYQEKTVQVYGTFTATATVEGSIDGTNYSPVEAGITSPGLVITQAIVKYIRVTVSGHSSGTVSSKFGGVNMRVAH